MDSAFFQGAQRYIAELRKNEQPWMLTLLTVGTHQPFGVPDDIAARYASPRDAAVALLDDAVASFLDKLKADGALDDTLVIVTSDESHGSQRWDWASSWSLHMVLAPEQAVLPRIKEGGFGLLDVEASVLDYLHFQVPSQIIGRSYFRNYDTPREMFSFTNMVLRRHSGDTNIRCAGGHSCVGGHAASLITRQPENLQQLPLQKSDETYAMAAALDNVLHASSDVQQFSFASGELREISANDSGHLSDVLAGGQYINIPANSDVTLHLKVTLLDGPKTGVHFNIQPARVLRKHDSLFGMPSLPKISSDWPALLPGEHMDKSLSFHTAHKIDRLSFFLHADVNKGLVRIDRLDITIKRNNSLADKNDENGISPLASAAHLGDASHVHALIEQGADVNATNIMGATALMMAVFGNHAHIVEMLLDKGANISASTRLGETAISIASGKNLVAIAEILLSRGANPNDDFIMNLLSNRLDIAKLMLVYGANIDLENKDTKRTPLITAAFWGRLKLINFLLEHGANVDVISSQGQNALSVALDRKHTDIAEILLAKGASANAALIPASWQGNRETVQFLLEHGADINHAGGVGVKRTPLMHAAYGGHKDLVAFLLDNGADVNARDAVGMTALRLAELRGYTDIVKILKNASAQK